MIHIFFLISLLGFSLEGMQAAVKEPIPVTKDYKQAFWAVCAALEKGDIEEAKALVNKTPGVLKCCDEKKRTLLHISLEKKWTFFSLWLVSLQNCPVNARDDQKRTPLMLATLVRETDVAAALVKRGVAFDALVSRSTNDSPRVGQQIWSAVRGKSNSILHDAVEKGDANLQALIEGNRALIDKQNAEGNTPLHLAVMRSDEKACELLLAAGATIILTNEEGRTPLHCAAALQSASLCSLLLKKIESLQVPDIQRMFLQPPRVQDGITAQALLLLSEEKNYTRHTEGLITITNDTTWRLKLAYVLTEKDAKDMLVAKTGEIIIEPGDHFLFYGPLSDLVQMHVSLYGKQLQYLQWEALDIYSAWKEEIKQLPSYTIEIKIIGQKDRIWQYISRFEIKSIGNGNEMYQPASRISPHGFIADAFPCVTSSLKKEKAITARNFLQVSSTASKQAVDLAYERLVLLWKRQLTIANKAYVDQVRKLLQLAYEAVLA